MSRQREVENAVWAVYEHHFGPERQAHRPIASLEGDTRAFLADLTETFGLRIRDANQTVAQLIATLATQWDGHPLEGINADGDFVPGWQR